MGYSLSFWSMFKITLFRYLGIIPDLFDHLIAATKEIDNHTPSAARVFAGCIFTVVLSLQCAIIGTLVWKVYLMDLLAPSAVAALQVLSKILLAFLLWSILFDVATALSLYGINVWRYVAAMRTGQAVKDDDDHDQPNPGPPPVPIKPDLVG